MNEASTRRRKIEPALEKAGWVEDLSKGIVILDEFPMNKGMLLGSGGKRKKTVYADYVLQYKGKRLAVVEAKSDEKPYTEGVAQAKDYAEHLDIRFTYSTNGDRHYLIDMKGNEGEVSTFHSPEELWKMTYQKESSIRDTVLSVPFELKGGWQLRYYQHRAIETALEAICEDKNRILLTLATGTGKTAIAFQIAWKLYKSGWNLTDFGKRKPRILFLADRNILADQAFNSFSHSFEEEALIRIRPSEIRKKGHVPLNGSIFFTIFQTFMSGEDGESDKPYFGEYPKDFFDLVIIDECHRGGANDESNWRDIMNYFESAIQIGLTATPKREENRDTYKYFGEPAYEYSLKRGIQDGYLTPFRVEQIESTIDEYTYSSKDKLIDGEIENEGTFGEKDFNRKIEIEEREAYRVKLFLSMINQNQKTLVFCATQRHAAMVRDMINQYNDSKNPNYCHRVTAEDGELGEKHLRDFQDNEKSIPTILTTSRKLSTGVDAPEVRNIILMRPVKSMVEFKQIVGRGTRLAEGKDYFTVYDFVKAHDHFNDDEWDGPPQEAPPVKKRLCKECGKSPCNCDRPQKVCDKCNNDPCICEPTKKIARVKLSEKHVLEIDSTVQTTFVTEDGKVINSEEFLAKLYGELPKLFKDQVALKKQWENPSTREMLLSELEELGYTDKHLDELRMIVKAGDCDLYDVLSHLAFQAELIPRVTRAQKATVSITDYSKEQKEFLDFILSKYVEDGHKELSQTKLPQLMELRYGGVRDAIGKLGDPEEIKHCFEDLQIKIYA
jgi:type I restriction enzyme R subunit